MKKLILVCLVSLLFIPSRTFASLDTNLYYGLRQNNNVTQLQKFLISKGFLTGNATGNFFSLTARAVKVYQTNKGISSTGYVGPLTRKAINGELAANIFSPGQPATNQTGATALTPSQLAGTKDTTANPSAFGQSITNQPGTSFGSSTSTTDASTSLQAQRKLLQDQLSLLQSKQNTSTLITSFKFAGFDSPANAGVIDNDHTIVVTLPDNTNLATLTPIIQLSANSTISPKSGIAQDFTLPVTYTVTDTHGDTQDYIVTVITEGNSG